MVKRQEFVQEGFKHTDEWRQVLAIAGRLQLHLDTPEVATAIDAANQPGRSSSDVQATFLDFAIELGFRDEATGLFVNYSNRGLRPDYFLPLGDSGIILEVERGKTNINNMDFLDFWKCHICDHAHYLFLMVPLELRQRKNGPASRPFATTVTHMDSFFQPRNYTNVRGLVVYGY